MTDGFDRALDTLKDCVGSVVDELTYKIHVEPYAALVTEHHRREIEHVKKAEYHRGYVDGTNQRKTETWQLDHDRAEALARIVNSNFESGSVMRSLSFVLGVDWNCDNTTRSLGKMKARLAYLLGGKVEDSNSQKLPNLEDSKPKEVTKALQDTIDLITDENESLKRECDKLINRVESYKQRIYSLEFNLRNAKADNHMYRTMLNDAADEYRLLFEQHKELRLKLLDWVPKSYHRKKMSIKQGYLDEAIRRADKLEEERDSLKSDCDMYRTMLNDASEQYVELCDNERYESNKAQELQNAYDDCGRKIDKMRNDCEMYRTMINDAATEYKKLKHDRDLLMKTLKKIKYDARRLVEHIFGDKS